MAKIKQAVKKTGKARKEVIVAELVEKMDASTGLVFTDYKGITHIQLENLKKDLKTMDSTIIIAKNSLLKISMGQSKKYADFKDNEALEAPTATLFINGDMVEPLKKLQKTVKELGLPKVKFGILEGNLTDEAGVMKIAALPSRETLIAQFVGTLNSPIQGLVVTLNATIQKFVMTLDAVAKTKPATAAAAPTAEPATATTTEIATENNDSSDAASTNNVEQSQTETASDSAIPSEDGANESADEATEVPTTEETPATEETNETSADTSTEEKTETDNEGGEN